MIKYALRCERGHGFESWFPDGAAFDKQRKRGLVDCPACGSIQIEKQIMAPNVSLKGGERSRAEAPPETPVTTDPTFVAASDQSRKLRAMMRELHAHVVANTEDLGGKFVEEARRIHNGEAEDRAIRGRASLAEARELHEEGIGVLPLPGLPDDRN